jgi:hypothetical protein
MVLLTHILHITSGVAIVGTWTICCTSSSLHLLASFTNSSRYPNLLIIAKIVSRRGKTILHLKKWVNILDLVVLTSLPKSLYVYTPFSTCASPFLPIVGGDDWFIFFWFLKRHFFHYTQLIQFYQHSLFIIN